MNYLFDYNQYIMINQKSWVVEIPCTIDNLPQPLKEEL